ncbi:hypothetical protein SAMN05519103_04114 [Rhizobiales bacterium GAS113]|nr:hypothetical protein SAMN05519103_04114 [Rhizobiales bacterium GAS113]
MQQVHRRIPEFTEQCEHFFEIDPKTSSSDAAVDRTRIARNKDEIEQAAAYVADLSADLAKIARGHSLGMLGDILDLAHMEAKRSMKLARR